jgi:hypothetical protein
VSVFNVGAAGGFAPGSARPAQHAAAGHALVLRKTATRTSAAQVNDAQNIPA